VIGRYTRKAVSGGGPESGLKFGARSDDGHPGRRQAGS